MIHQTTDYAYFKIIKGHCRIGYKDTRIQGYKSDNYFIEFTIVIILK